MQKQLMIQGIFIREQRGILQSEIWDNWVGLVNPDWSDSSVPMIIACYSSTGAGTVLGVP